MKKLLLTITVLVLSSTIAYADIAAPPATAKSKEDIKEEIRSHIEQVKTACAADVATTGCTGEGREMMKCVREYKKKNKDFKLNEDCHSAMKSGRELKKERKMARKEHKKGKKHDDKNDDDKNDDDKNEEDKK
ncbi:MAG: hypothetical protein ABL930_10115 [Pseudobdellovibrio sp.]